MVIDELVLQRCHHHLVATVWTPPSPIVVLGRSNPIQDVQEAHCGRLNVPITRRIGGGGTVLLYSGCIVVTLGGWVADRFKNDYYFREINSGILDVLASLGLKGSDQKGISDLTYGDRKFAGTSLFRSKNYLLYQASIIVTVDMTLLEQCLSHPHREPDYRYGRSHRDFLTGLDKVMGHPHEEIVRKLKSELIPSWSSRLKGDLIDPDRSHLPYLVARCHSRDLDEWEKVYAERIIGGFLN